MAAHVDGMAASVVDMTGLAQKGGAVFSHVRIGAEETTPVAGRVPAASAHVVIACDLLVAAGPEALALYAKDRTVACGNADFQPTADFVTKPRRALTTPLPWRAGWPEPARATTPARPRTSPRPGWAIRSTPI